MNADIESIAASLPADWVIVDRGVLVNTLMGDANAASEFTSRELGDTISALADRVRDGLSLVTEADYPDE